MKVGQENKLAFLRSGKILPRKRRARRAIIGRKVGLCIMFYAVYECSTNTLLSVFRSKAMAGMFAEDWPSPTYIVRSE